jgi:probable rRNA maturation factor
LQAEGIKDKVELSVWLTTDPTMQRLNRQHRRINQPTDVLSFPQIEWTESVGKFEPANLPTSQPLTHLGDVVISLPTAQRQAKKQGWSLEQEIAWLTVHGVLHLLGYNDETKLERDRMLKRQEEILTAVSSEQ